MEGGDKSYYFNYRDINDNKKLKWVNVGKYSEGYREINAFNLRGEQISKMKHGEDITVISNKKKIEIITYDNLAQTYFTDKNSTKNRKSRYNIHIKDVISNKDICNIKRKDIEDLLKSVEVKGLSNQTLNSVKELISTIYNHHIKKYELQ